MIKIRADVAISKFLSLPTAYDAVTRIMLKTETPIGVKSAENSHKYDFATTFYRDGLSLSSPSYF